MRRSVAEETERLKRVYEKEAPIYDRRMGFFERVLFGDGREWVCSRASGEVLEVALGTGRNLPFYPQGVWITGIELSPAMLEIARKRAEELDLDADLREMPRSCRFRMLLSTRWSARSPCATYPTIAEPSRR
jgi:ubiquinone/menaquinone biosynthesis C-methylase UbiE